MPQGRKIKQNQSPAFKRALPGWLEGLQNSCLSCSGSKFNSNLNACLCSEGSFLWEISALAEVQIDPSSLSGLEFHSGVYGLSQS